MSRPAGSRVWLIPLARDLVARDVVARAAAARAAAPRDLPAHIADLDLQLADDLRARRLETGPPTDALGALRPGADLVAFDEYACVNDAVHALEIALRVLHAAQPPAPNLDAVRVLCCLACAAPEPALAAAAEALLAAPDHADRKTVRAANALARDLGDSLARESLSAGHPLLGHPFQQLLRYTHLQRVGRVAAEVARALPHHPPDRAAVLRAQGLAVEARHQAVSACIGLACADGIVDPEERRLIGALMRAARFDPAAQAMHLAEFDDPPSPEALVARVTEAPLRRFVVRMLFLAALVNGRFHAAEQAWLARLGAGFGLPPDELERCEAEALVAYEGGGDLVAGLSRRATVSRLRAELARRVEQTVRLKARAVAAEIRETSELGQLLLKAGRVPLTEEERATVKAQLRDLAKAVPALAMFAMPGGSLLLPLMVKHLPFNILPSNFVDEEPPTG